MIKCPKCDAIYPLNTLFCSECGEYLSTKGRTTTAIRFSDAADDETSCAPEDGAQAACTDEAGLTESSESVTLLIGETPQRMTVPLKNDLLLGRLDPINNNYPDVNLAPYGAMDQGVSRRHARILYNDGSLEIEDLGSVNGSTLNGTPLTPYSARPLVSGDVLQLGKLTIKIIF